MRITLHKVVCILWHFAAFLSFWSFGYTMLAAGDLWWHLATGRFIVQGRTLPRVDTWSFTYKSAPWLQHEWLSDVSYHLWTAAFSMATLVYWKWGMIIATFFLVMQVCYRLSKDFISAYLTAVFSLAVAAPFLDIRPHLYSLLGYALLLYIGLREDRTLPLWLPTLFILWVNLHGGFFFGLMALAVITVFSTNRRKNIRVFALCMLACLINPNGPHAFLYPLRYALNQDSPYRVAIAEWASPFVAGGIGAPLYPYAVATFVLATGFLLWKREYRNRVALMVLALGLLTLAMSFTSRRFIPLFTVSQAMTVALALAKLLKDVTQKIPAIVPPLVAVALGLFLLWPYPKTQAAFHYLTAEDQFPVEVCNFIEVNGLSGNVFAYYGWGGYLHLRTAGRMKVFIDGRADTVFDDETVRLYSRVQGFKEGWQKVIESNDTEYILWPRDSRGRPLAELVQSGRWRLLYDDAVSVLLVRSERAPLRLNQTPDSGHKHLALGVKSFERQQFDVSEKELEKAIEMLPASNFSCQLLTDLYKKQGKTGQAAEQDRRCKRDFPVSSWM